MKKLIRKAPFVLIAAAVLLSVSGCGFTAQMMRDINMAQAETICSALEEKYGETFAATSIGDRLGTGHTKTFVYPAADSNIVFTAVMTDSGELDDDYVNNIILDKIEKSIVAGLGEKGITSCATSTILSDDVRETDRELTPNEFAEKNGLESVLIMIAADGADADYDAVVQVLEERSAEYSFRLSVYTYFYGHEQYGECERLIRAYPYVGATLMESFLPERSFFLRL